MNHILLIEDSEDIQQLIKKTFEDRCYLSCASTAADALSLLEKIRFDLILLDVGLPDSDGFKLCAQLRSIEKAKDTALMFLTAKSDLADKILGFSLGADDYIVKPFERLELLARVESKLSKMRKHHEESKTIRAANLLIKTSSHAAFIIDNGIEKNLNLTPIEFKLLHCLVRNPDRILTREQLLDAAWGNDIHVIDRTVDKHISGLRKKLGKLGESITTLPNVGYQFSVENKAKNKV